MDAESPKREANVASRRYPKAATAIVRMLTIPVVRPLAGFARLRPVSPADSDKTMFFVMEFTSLRLQASEQRNAELSLDVHLTVSPFIINDAH